jgi:hypothetical protein
MNKNKHLSMMRVLRIEKKKIGKKDVECVVVISDEVVSGDANVELHAATKHFRVQLEGPRDGFFVNDDNEAAENEVVEVQGGDMLPNEVIERVHLTHFDDNDIAQIRGVVETDNDNDPLPENIPTINDNNNNECNFAQQWGHSGTCYRKMEGVQDPEVKFPNRCTSFTCRYIRTSVSEAVCYRCHVS